LDILIAEAMRVAVSDPQLLDNARRFGECVTAEDGATQVVSFVTPLFRQST
jgi:hypothetical protein